MCTGTLERAVRRLSRVHGPQHWWPAGSPFEMAVGALLVQHTSWRNAELALENLRGATAFDAVSVAHLPIGNLEALVRPSGTFRVKARRLQALALWWAREFESATAVPTRDLRATLRALHGIGPETADCVLLYAFSRPMFIADAYARRWFCRMGLTKPDTTYAAVQYLGHAQLPDDIGLLQEAHALIVVHNQRHCVARHPNCKECTLSDTCARVGLAV